MIYWLYTDIFAQILLVKNFRSDFCNQNLFRWVPTNQNISASILNINLFSLSFCISKYFCLNSESKYFRSVSTDQNIIFLPRFRQSKYFCCFLKSKYFASILTKIIFWPNLNIKILLIRFLKSKHFRFCQSKKFRSVSIN